MHETFRVVFLSHLLYAICVKISIMNLCFLKSYTNKRTFDRPWYTQSRGSCSANYWWTKYEGELPHIYLLWSTVKGCFLFPLTEIHICRGSLPSIIEKRTCFLFNDDQLSSIINMLASSWIKHFFHSIKSEEARWCCVKVLL